MREWRLLRRAREGSAPTTDIRQYVLTNESQLVEAQIDLDRLITGVATASADQNVAFYTLKFARGADRECPRYQRRAK